MTAPIDEDRLVIPAAWLRGSYPRRGGVPVGFRPESGAAGKVANLVEQAEVEEALRGMPAAADLRPAGLAYLADPAGATPLQAAVVARLVVQDLEYDSPERLKSIVDAWVAGRGLEFAVRATVECVALSVETNGGPYTPGRRNPTRYPYQLTDGFFVLFRRVRAALAVAPDDEYAALVDVLASYRDRSPHHRLATTVLAPTETAWVDEEIRTAAANNYGPGPVLALLMTAGTAAQVATLAPHLRDFAHLRGILATLFDSVGVDATDAIVGWLDGDYLGADGIRGLLAGLALVPTDAAFQALLERLDRPHVGSAVIEATQRFPRRAIRLLAATDNRAASDLLRTYLSTHRALAEELLPTLPATAAARVRTLLGDAAAVAEAPATALPAILAAPPWTVRRTAGKPVVIAGLACTDQPRVDWAPGERERWRELPTEGVPRRANLDYARIADQMRAGSGDWYSELQLLVYGPDEIVRPALAHWQPYGFDGWEVRMLAARFDVDALPTLLRLARQNPAGASELLLPFESPEVASYLADGLVRLKSVRASALAWLDRHPAAATRALVPAALGPAGKPRQQAENALLALAARGHRDTVHAEAARVYGELAATAIAGLLDTDPLLRLPAKLPALPLWADPALLPPVRLRDGSGALPAGAVRHVLTMLAISRIDEPYPGLAIVRDACEPTDLAELAWSLFARWQAADLVAKEGWVLDAQGLLGDDDTVRRLAPLIRAWPGSGGHQRAVAALEVLVALGSEVALMHLHGIAQKATFAGLRERATERVAQVAAGLGLSADELADRLVPDFGLAPDGSLRLDYGPRQFVVGFDEQLRPYVATEDGTRRKELPKPGAKDDKAMADPAYRRFGVLKKDVRTVAGDVIHRLERAMVDQRRWSTVDFRRYFVDHPLLWHIVHRLVWGSYHDSGERVTAFRLAEDRSFADVTDSAVTIADDATVGVVHPLHLTGDLATWGDLFADYEILQPFPQLGRGTHRLTDAELSSSTLDRLVGRKASTGTLLGLERRGWWRESPQDSGHQSYLARDLAGGLTLVVRLDPGVIVGDISVHPEQVLRDVRLCGPADGGFLSRGTGRHRLGEVDPLTLSELLRDLEEVS